jgi:hypothetical protein
VGHVGHEVGAEPLQGPLAAELHDRDGEEGAGEAEQDEHDGQPRAGEPADDEVMGDGRVEASAHPAAPEDPFVRLAKGDLDAQARGEARGRAEALHPPVVGHHQREGGVGHRAVAERAGEERSALDRLAEPVGERFEVDLVADQPFGGGAVDEAPRAARKHDVRGREALESRGVHPFQPRGKPAPGLFVEGCLHRADPAGRRLPDEDTVGQGHRLAERVIPRAEPRERVRAQTARRRRLALQRGHERRVSVVADLHCRTADHLARGEGGVVPEHAFRGPAMVGGAAVGLEGEEGRGQEAGHYGRGDEHGPCLFESRRACHEARRIAPGRAPPLDHGRSSHVPDNSQTGSLP